MTQHENATIIGIVLLQALNFNQISVLHSQCGHKDFHKFHAGFMIVLVHRVKVEEFVVGTREDTK